MRIKIDDLNGPEIAALLQEHLEDMYATSPPDSVHALDLTALRQPEITFWTLWDGDSLAGCGAMKHLSPRHAEIKSMRTAGTYRGQGVASAILQHIIHEAEQRAYQRLSLETGSMAFFAPARRLYMRFGFTLCGPFGDYIDDPNSVFMTKEMPNTV